MNQLHQGWLYQLYETYEHCSEKPEFMTGDNPLLPICHTTQNAHIEITLDDKGQFLTARALEKGKLTTIVPCTEGSAGRSGSKPVNHPLCDKLQYVAGDYLDYGGDVTSGFKKQPEAPYQNYLSQLGDWVNSADSHPKAAAIYQYVSQATLIADLVREHCLFIDDDNKLIKQWKWDELSNSSAPQNILGNRYAEFADKLAEETDPKKHARIFSEYAPPVYKIIPPGQTVEAALIRWRVETPNVSLSASWEDQSLFHSWVNFYSQRETKEDLCIVTGENTAMASQHPSGIRHGADKAKLISSNDSSGFTFRGRFTDKGGEQACTVSADVTQKAHNALRWLVQRKQAYRFGDQVFVSWAVAGEVIPDPLANTASMWDEPDEPDETPEQKPQTEVDIGDVGQHYAKRLANMISGYRADLSDTQNVIIMGLDSATPGRMAVTYYRALEYSAFLTRLQHWHDHFKWQQNFSKDKKFTGAPSPKDIAETAYGRRLDDKLKKVTVERLLPCIIDQSPFPQDLLASCLQRVVNRVGMEKWEWEKLLGITCALYRGCNQQENYSMGLEEDRTNRNYLYGRLLAVADYIEEYSQLDHTKKSDKKTDEEKSSEKKRQTNAARYMQQFVQNPSQTWPMLYGYLNPYMTRIKTNRYPRWRQMMDLLDEIQHQFESVEDFNSSSKLTGEYLLAYHCQRKQLWQGKNKTAEASETTSESAA